MRLARPTYKFPIWSIEVVTLGHLLQNLDTLQKWVQNSKCSSHHSCKECFLLEIYITKLLGRLEPIPSSMIFDSIFSRVEHWSDHWSDEATYG
jgi:hypothetical protein